MTWPEKRMEWRIIKHWFLARNQGRDMLTVCFALHYDMRRSERNPLPAAPNLFPTMAMTLPTERFQVSLHTPAGPIATEISVSTGFVPVTSIVPLMRSLGEQAQDLEEQHARQRGESVSCREGCAACCRMLVPLSPPEVFTLRASLERLPAEHQTRLQARVNAAKLRLQEAGLWKDLQAVSESPDSLTDEQLEPLNQAYYALRLPCPFLEDEHCSIYEHRPAACRELLVTSPAKFCDDMTDPRIRPLPLSLRIGTALGLLWADLTHTAPRLVPLPIALDWAFRHEAESRRAWPGTALFDQALDKLWRYLSHEFERRKSENE
jgi:Fe-S-cluster containining protein